MKTVFLILGVTLVGISIIGCGSSIPKKINDTIFEKSEFSVPITLTLPSEDDPKYLERLKNEIHTLMPIFHGSANRIDKGVLEVLVRYGFVNVEKITVRWSTLGVRSIEYSQHEILIYSDKIRPYIYKGDFKKYGEEFEIRLALRLLKSIDYSNEYKDPLRGPGNIFAGAFSYTLKKDFPYLEELVKAASSPSQFARLHLPYFLKNLKINKTYKGKAEAYLDPTDGQWKLGSIVLEDKSPAIFKMEVAQDEKKMVPDGRKVFKTSISGRYVVKSGESKIPPGTSVEFKRDGIFSANIPFKWKIEGSLLKFGNGRDKGSQVLDNTIVEPQTGNVIWLKQEGAELIKKINGGMLWSKYIFKLREIRKGGLSLEFKKDGTGAIINDGKWQAEGNNLRVFDFESKELKGKIRGNIIELEGFGTLLKQTQGAKTFIFTVIIIIGFLVLFAGILIARKIIKPTISRGNVVSTGIFCTQCGNKNLATASFCTNCGHKIE
jgi:hypothetical protein